jgi:hypothetical protein
LTSWRQAVAAALLVMVQENASGLPRILLVLVFTFFVPGRAIITNFPRMARWSDLGASMLSAWVSWPS